MSLGLRLLAVVFALLSFRANAADSLLTTLTRDPEAPRAEVVSLALRAHACAAKRGLTDSPLVTLVDFSMPSRERRLWVIDLDEGKVLRRELVAHGRGSGEDLATSFSDRPESRKSSIGVYLTDVRYQGEHGLSLKLTGLEPGFNGSAVERAIVMHGAGYVNDLYAATHSRLGRSWGCFALDPSVCGQVINQIQRGTILVAYYPDVRWLRESSFLNCDG